MVATIDLIGSKIQLETGAKWEESLNALFGDEHEKEWCDKLFLGRT